MTYKELERAYEHTLMRLWDIHSNMYDEIKTLKNNPLIATAGTIATKLHDMGIDPIEAIELIPEIVKFLEDMESDSDLLPSFAWKPAEDILNRIKLNEDKCEHGKATNDYCEPCGRIHSD